jgi:hypothetical protein
LQNITSIESSIVEAEYGFINGVIHIVDKPLIKFLIPDMITGLDYNIKTIS